VLYGVDDGARTLDDSVAMVRMAAQAGTTDIVCSPHANPTYHYDPELIRTRVGEIAGASGNAVRLHIGCDFHLSYDNIQDAVANPKKYTINGKCYLLVEFSDLLIFNNTPEIFARLQEQGMIPIVTHPERNALLRQRIDNIAKWVEAGALVQVTAQSILGEFGNNARDFSETLLNRGLVHFIASDAHDTQRRPPRLDLAHAWLKKRRGEALADALCIDNPRATLTGDVVDLPDVDIPRSTRKWYHIFR